MTIAHFLAILNASGALVVVLLLAYVIGLDLVKVIESTRRIGLRATLTLSSLAAIVAQDVTAEHAISLAATGFVLGLAAGQSLGAAAWGAVIGAAASSVADEREKLLEELKKAFGLTVPPAALPTK